jgi:hypothetical protein
MTEILEKSSSIIQKEIRYELIPGKAESEFRNYLDSKRQLTVENHYRAMRQYQTEEFVEKMESKWKKFNFDRLTVREAFKKVNLSVITELLII